MTKNILYPLIVVFIITIAGAILDVQILKAEVQSLYSMVAEIKHDVKFIRRHHEQ